VNQTPSETYRDNIATVDASGKRRWIYPSIPKGKFTTYRKWFSYLLILFLIGMPFVKVDGHPYFLLNVVDRHFILFGQPFWPQDLKILLLILITFILFIIAFTSIWGRLWCGWACPQTVFLEMVFRRVEFAIEGDGLAQKKLNKAPWNLNKISKKLSKHFIFVLLAYGVGHIFLSWIIGVDQLKRIVSEPIQDHLAGFIGINFFSLMFYAVFSWFREQACVIVCPYGRFQSVLLDKNTTVISYDFKRGEPRGKRSKAQDLSHQGDCVNCLQCVRVCPTGIDIRQGTQLECVNCTACIDACDHIMTKLKLPKGLIKFASYNQISQGFQKHFTTRVKAYIFVLTLLLGICVSLIFTRDSVHVTVTRVHGSVYQELADGSILNLYKIKFANNSFKEKTLTLKLSQDRGELRAPAQINIPSYNTQEVMINVQLKKNELINKKLQIPLQVFENKQVISEEKLTFISPIQKP
jgi:cytochrome c oxidase accessory protein FixG